MSVPPPPGVQVLLNLIEVESNLRKASKAPPFGSFFVFRSRNLTDAFAAAFFFGVAMFYRVIGLSGYRVMRFCVRPIWPQCKKGNRHQAGLLPGHYICLPQRVNGCANFCHFYGRAVY